jgi:hypothetical protein
MYLIKTANDKLGLVRRKLSGVFTAILGLLLLSRQPVASDPGAAFVDRAADAGLAFRLENFPTDEKFLIETMTGGCAFLDYDRDGLLDIFLVNGAAIDAPHFDKSDPL